MYLRVTTRSGHLQWISSCCPFIAIHAYLYKVMRLEQLSASRLLNREKGSSGRVIKNWKKLDIHSSFWEFGIRWKIGGAAPLCGESLLQNLDPTTFSSFLYVFQQECCTSDNSRVGGKNTSNFVVSAPSVLLTVQAWRDWAGVCCLDPIILFCGIDN